MSDSDQSLGDEKTFGDQVSKHSAASSLGDEVTMGGLSGAEDTLLGQDMELVDLSKRYTIEGALGKGGMGEVLLATDLKVELIEPLGIFERLVGSRSAALNSCS